MIPKKLKVEDRVGAGLFILGLMPETIDCGEFVLKADYQVIAIEQWIQFPEKKWEDMIKTVFTQMVDAWNEKYGVQDVQSMQAEKLK